MFLKLHTLFYTVAEVLGSHVQPSMYSQRHTCDFEVVAEISLRVYIDTTEIGKHYRSELD